MISWDVYHELDVPSSVKNVLVDHPNAKTRFAIIYTNGERPPESSSGSTVGAGLSFEF